MSKTASEEKIRKLSADYIHQEAVCSMLLLLLSAMEDAEKGITALPCDIPGDVREIKEKVQSYLLRLEELSESDEAARAAALADCMELKRRLLSIYETVYGYFSRWNIVSTLVSDQVALRKYKEEGVAQKQVEWSLFFSDCHAFLGSAENQLQQKDYIGQILKCIPLYMTRENYYDTLRASLEAALADESKEMLAASLKAFQGFCCPEADPCYGKYFPALAEQIGQKLLILPHKLSDEALAALFAELEETFETLGQIEEYFACILHDINSLIILFYLNNSFAELTEDDAAHADLYHTVCDFISDRLTLTEKAAYLDTLMEQLENAIEASIDKSHEIGKKEYSLLQQAGSFAGFAEDTMKVLLTEDFVRECYFNDLPDELFHFDIPADLPPATVEEREALFVDFISKTSNYFNTLPAQTRRLAMQNLLYALPPLEDAAEALERVTAGIAQADGEQKVLIVDKIGTVFHENGWEPLIYKDSDGCGCGHEHHHHEGCGCGHEHRHHHE